MNFQTRTQGGGCPSSSQVQYFGVKRGCFKRNRGCKNKNFRCLAANFFLFSEISISKGAGKKVVFALK